MKTVSKVLTELVVDAAEGAGHGGVLDDVEAAVPTNNPKFGDYQSNHAFRLGKQLRTNPRGVAEQVAIALGESPIWTEVSVAGPGFINFRLSNDWLAQHLATVCEDRHLGVEQTGAGKTLVIDYSAPNVAKRMHVGHMRSTLIGNAMYRLHGATGWETIGDNHIGDWGTQFGKLIVAWRNWLDEEAYEADPIAELERLYVHFGQQAEQDPDLVDQARAETAKLQAGDPDNRALWQQFIEVSLAEFNRVYERLGIEFDATLGESAYNDALPGVVQGLLEAGIATESEGAIVVMFGAEAGPSLQDTVLVVRKKDGAYLYGTTDLATLDHRQKMWDPDRILYVTDTRQQLHFRQVFHAWRAWRRDPDVELVHSWFGMLKLGGSIAAARTGNVIRFVDLLDEGVSRAREVVDDKSPELSEEERAEIAEAVGVAAIRYADLSQNPQSDVSFDWDRMLSLEGNTAPFLMYSYARCRSIQRKGGVDSPDVTGLAIEHPAERELALNLVRFPEMVGVAVDGLRPNLLCDHLFATASSLNKLYAQCPVLTAETEVQKASRLALVEATARVLARGMEILGIPALDRM